jgi:hypothetical protein
MSRALIRVFLGVSGALLLVTGLAVLFDPLSLLGIEVSALSGIASLLSELRSPGLLLIICAGVSFAGAFRPRYAATALVLSALLYGSFGVSRLVSLVIDGTPSTSILAAMAIELIAGLLAVLARIGLEKARSHRRGHDAPGRFAGELS